MSAKRSIFELNYDVKKIRAGRLVVLAFICAAALTGLMYSGIFENQNKYLSDRLYQRPSALDGNIFVLGIDERALENIGPFNTWTRDIMAQVIETLNVSEDCRPAVIGVDVMYFGDSDPQTDKMLADAAAEYDNVVMGSNLVFESALIEEGENFYMEANTVQQVEFPFDELAEAAAVGHLNSFADRDGVIRHALTYVELPEALADEYGMTRSESFALQIYKKYTEAMEVPQNLNMPLSERNEWYIPYSAKPGGYGDGFSVWDVLSGDLPAEMFADTIVLIGPYAAGMRDHFSTPIDKGQTMYGVEIHANVVDAMLKGQYREELPKAGQIAGLLISLFLLFFAFYFLSVTLSFPLMLAAGIGYIVLARQLVFPTNENWFNFAEGFGELRYMADPLYFPLSAFLLYIVILAVNIFAVQRQKKQVTDTFKKYVDPAIIDDIFEKGLDDLQLGGKKTDICVMFVDIRGFTPMSEVMSPEEVVSILGEYLQLTTEAVFRHKGTLDKFIGDATMAFFNAPLPQEDYIYKAVCTAWDIVRDGAELEADLYEKYGRRVGFGIGLHCGEAVVGNIGTPVRVDYTAIGNTVNTAARLESNAKKGQVLMSSEVYQQVKDRVEAVCIGNIPLKGKSEEITVYELINISEILEEGR